MQRFFSRLADWTLGLAAVGIAFAVALNLLQILYRYVLFDPLAWTEEVMRYVLIWVMMLGIGAALYRSEEAAAPMLAWVRSPPFQRVLHWFRIALVFVFAGILIFYGLGFGRGASTQVSPSAQIPMVLPYFAFFVGGIVVLVLAIGMVIAPAPPSEIEDVRPEDAI